LGNHHVAGLKSQLTLQVSAHGKKAADKSGSGGASVPASRKIFSATKSIESICQTAE
jgi:hypothetical protein